ncbi:hypothetical protein DFR30_2569 [Thiogranum longum]|uniref:Uncharacterized protein n=1 Tax=Thiogranum longum TaxID=1537524 RepID=A0A4R1HIJ4_9GAMM|nr:DUF6776 family protein [Thiogranum longum]TCK19259.1 hypothetical protein DFR30_2569 [Thiogranum longum]
MDSSQRKILVYSPRMLWLLLGILVLLALLGASMAFNFGKQYAGDELVQLKSERGHLDSQIEKLEKRNRELRERVAVLEKSSEIDRLANLEVRDSYAALQNELLELRRELEFYRGIVSPGGEKAGLRIQRLELVPGHESGHFDYNLTLTQLKRNDRYARGTIALEVEGLQDGKQVKLPLSALTPGDAAVLNYKFRYFQHFAGELVLPDGFEPQRVTVRLKPRGKGQPSGVETTMEWPT